MTTVSKFVTAVKEYKRIVSIPYAIEYSLSFIRGIESSYHQTFSLGALWRISQVLGIDFTKLCESDEETHFQRFVNSKH